MELLNLLEFAAKSGFLALVLTLWGLQHQTAEIRRMRARHEVEEKACEKRVERLQKALIELHLWARPPGGGRRRKVLPDLSHLLEPPEIEAGAKPKPEPASPDA